MTNSQEPGPLTAKLSLDQIATLFGDCEPEIELAAAQIVQTRAYAFTPAAKAA